MKNFLVTGGLGFIGSNFINYMSNKYPHIKLIILDINDYCSSIDNIEKTSLHNTEIIIGDIANAQLVTYILEKYEIDTIVHFAAQTHVDNSFFNSFKFTKVNVLGTHSLLETVRIYHQKTGRLEKFIHVSTDEVYGQVTDNNIRKETSTLDPTNPYAASKAAAEFMVKSYHYSYKLPVIITRGNNVYGKNQHIEKAIPKFISQLLDNQKITIHGTGHNTRNFIHTYDVCTAFETIILKGKIGEVYNISSNHEGEIKIIDLAKKIISLMYPNEDVENPDIQDKYIAYVEDRNFNDFRYYICNEKLTSLGWKVVKDNFDANIEELIEWYSAHRHRYHRTFKDNIEK